MATKDLDLAHAAAESGLLGQRTAVCGADELRGLLSHIAEQIVEADRRHSDLLRQLQDRLAYLAEETRSASARAPEQHAESFRRIESGVADLVTRAGEAAAEPTPDPAPMALRSASGAAPRSEKQRPADFDPFDVLDTSRPGDAANPWDASSAEALAALHESGATGFAVEMPDPDRLPARQPLPAVAAAAAGTINPPTAGPVADLRMQEGLASAASLPEVDKAWLADQISSLARRLEDSIGALSPATDGHDGLGARFAEFEDRLASALDLLATRSDVEALGLVEAHISELSGHLAATQTQLARLATIEDQLHSVIEQLSDERLSRVVPAPAEAPSRPDFALLASEAAEKAAARVQSIAAPAQNDNGSAEIRSMLNRFIDERRIGEEHTISMLDTMQQALIRVLDRMDAMELHQHKSHAVPAQTVPARAAAVASAAPAAAMPVQEAERIEPTLTVRPAPVKQGADPARAAQTELPPTAAIDRVRQDLKAEAQRAKAKAEAEAAEAALKADAPAKGSVLKASGASQPKLGKKALMLGAVVLVAAAAGSTLFMKKTRRPPGAQPVAIEKPVKSDPAVSGEATETSEAPSAEASSNKPKLPAIKPRATIRALPAPSNKAPSEAPADPSAAAPGGMPEASAPEAADDLSLGEERGPAHTANAAGTGDVAMPLGMTLQRPTDAPLAADLFKVALAPEGGSAASEKSPALDLPPSTVGPLSLRLAAAKGDPSAEFEVGARLAEGKGTSQNFQEAIRWYQRSATRGFAQAQYRLGTLYERGLGAPADLSRARVWYQRAAEQGNVKAMHNMAVLSAGRETGAPDYDTASRWFRAAAERGLPDSQFNLGVLCESGLGVQKNPGEAFKWYSLAAQGGDKEAVRRRDALRTQLAPAQLAEAEALVKAFVPERPDPLINDARVAGEDWKKRQGDNG
jgi:localization factor PodJL